MDEWILTIYHTIAVWKRSICDLYAAQIFMNESSLTTQLADQFATINYNAFDNCSLGCESIKK
jgi:hypothetical protein